MQIILAFAAWGTLFSLLTGLPAKPDATKPDVKLPDQAKLQGYLERCEKAVGASWLIKTQYNIARGSAFDSDEKGVGQVMLLRLPGMPEVFWQSETMADRRRSFTKVYVGQCRLILAHGAIKASAFAIDLRIARLGCLRTEDRFWGKNVPYVLVKGSIGSYDFLFHDGDIFFVNPDVLGIFDKIVQQVLVFIRSRGPVGLLLCMETKQAHKRFEIKLTKDDENYIYVEVFPKSRDDTADFAKAQIVIDKSTFLPRRLWYAESNRDTNTFNFTQMLTRP